MSDWCPGAIRLSSSHSGGSMVGGPPRVVWHRTVGGSFETNAGYLKSKGYEPHILWDPRTGQIGQYLPASVSGYALKASSAVQTNRRGSVCVQIEMVDHGETFSLTDSPMLGLGTLLSWLRSLGIPDEWPAGLPSRLGSSGNRDANIWNNRAGHYGHCHVPANDHTDPGPIDPGKFFGHAAPPAAPPAVDEIGTVMASFPVVTQGANGNDVRTVQGLVNARGVGCSVDGDFGPATTRAVIAVQSQHGLSTDGDVGPLTWRALLGR